MSIEFTCEHCRKPIHAPDHAAGKRGRCPHCQAPMQVPARPAAEDIYDIKDDDPADARRQQEAEERARLERWQLLQHRDTPEGPDAPVAHRDDDSVRPADLRRAIADFVEAHAAGNTAQANSLALVLAQNRREVLLQIDLLMQDEIAAAELTPVARPVLMKYLKQLRTKLAAK